jgi:hypothetical protein
MGAADGSELCLIILVLSEDISNIFKCSRGVRNMTIHLNMKLKQG